MASNVQHASIMVKAFSHSAFVLSALLGATAIVVACSSSDPSEFPGDPPKPDAESDAPGNFLPEGGGPDSSLEAGPKSCPPAAIPQGFTPTWKPPTRNATACTTMDIKGYYDACLADPGKTEGDGTCAKWKTANATCAACTEPADNSGPIQWHQTRKFLTTNIAGCIAVAQAKPEAGKCGDAYNAAVECGRKACDFCYEAGGNDEQYGACQSAAKKAGLCKSYDDAASAACAGINDPTSPALPCLRTSSAEDRSVYYPRLIGVICGP
jgi:hypothetical protein